MDIFLVGLVGLSVFAGWRTGFVRRLLGLGFIALSLVAGAYLRHPIGAFAGAFIKGVPADYADLVGYTIAFPVILATAHLIARPVLANVAVKGLARTTDLSLGAIFGGAEAVLLISAAVVILDTYFTTTTSPGPTNGVELLRQLSAGLNGSTTVHLLRDTTIPFVLAVLGPLLPKDVTSLVSGGLPAGIPVSLPGGLPFPTP